MFKRHEAKALFLFYHFFKLKGRKENENDSNYNSRKGNSGLGTEGKREKSTISSF